MLHLVGILQTHTHIYIYMYILCKIQKLKKYIQITENELSLKVQREKYNSNQIIKTMIK